MTPTPMATRQQMGAIHGLAKQAGFDDEMRRGLMERVAGVRSTKQLTAADAHRVIVELEKSAGGARAKGAVAGLDSPVGRKLRALWIAGRDLGLVKDRSDRAMLSFLERQTGVSHTRFLSAPGQGTAAIEGLKGWLARAGGVEWPQRDDGAALASRLAVVMAQWKRLEQFSCTPAPRLVGLAFKLVSKHDLTTFDAADFNTVQRSLGRRLRAALTRRDDINQDTE